jgi:hypothetical protein
MRRSILRWAVLSTLYLLGNCFASAQTTVRQSGSVSPGHPVRWITTGVVGDGGTASQGLLTGLGVTASGPSICARSASTGASNRICLGATATGGGTISVDNIGGGTGGFRLQLNGVTQGLATVTLPVAAGDVACFADTTGTLRDCAGGGGGTGPVGTFWAGTGTGLPPVFRAIVGSDLPNPTALTLGGVFALPVTNNQVLSGIGTDGVPTRATLTGTAGSAVVLASNPSITSPVLTSSNLITSLSFASVKLYDEAASFRTLYHPDGSNPFLQWNATAGFIKSDTTTFSSSNGVTTFADITSSGLRLYGSTSGSTLFTPAAISGTSQITFPAGTGTVRLQLPSSITIYVATTGNDSNTCLAVGVPCLTIQHAIDLAVGYDLGNFSITISVADGTYSTTGSAIVLKSYVSGSGTISIVGNTTTPSNVVVSVTTGFGIIGSSVRGAWTLSGMKVTTLTAGYDTINVSLGTRLSIVSAWEFGAAGGTHITATYGASVIISTNYTISGGAGIHWNVSTQALVQAAGHTLTITGTPTFTTWAQAIQGGGLVVHADTFSGAITAGATQYTASTVGWIYTAGAGAGYFPGTVGGSATSGGVYN